MKLAYSLLLLAVALCVLSCSDDPPSAPVPLIEDYCDGCFEPAAVEGLIPLAVGNRWVYEYSRYDTLGNAIVSDSTVRIWVEKVQNVDGVDFYVVAYRSLGYQSFSYVHARNSAEGFCVGHVKFSSSRYFYRLYKHPAVLGEHYGNSDSLPLFGWQVLWLEAQSVQVSVDAGLFECLHYHGYPKKCPSGGHNLKYAAPLSIVWGCNVQSGLTGQEDQWYDHYIAPGVGVVRQVVSIDNNGLKTIHEWKLKEFSLE